MENPLEIKEKNMKLIKTKKDKAQKEKKKKKEKRKKNNGAGSTPLQSDQFCDPSWGDNNDFCVFFMPN